MVGERWVGEGMEGRPEMVERRLEQGGAGGGAAGGGERVAERVASQGGLTAVSGVTCRGDRLTSPSERAGDGPRGGDMRGGVGRGLPCCRASREGGRSKSGDCGEGRGEGEGDRSRCLWRRLRIIPRNRLASRCSGLRRSGSAGSGAGWGGGARGAEGVSQSDVRDGPTRGVDAHGVASGVETHDVGVGHPTKDSVNSEFRRLKALPAGRSDWVRGDRDTVTCDDTIGGEH